MAVALGTAGPVSSDGTQKPESGHTVDNTDKFDGISLNVYRRLKMTAPMKNPAEAGFWYVLRLCETIKWWCGGNRQQPPLKVPDTGVPASCVRLRVAVESGA